MRFTLSQNSILSLLLVTILLPTLSGCGGRFKQKTATLIRTDLPDISKNTNIIFIKPSSALQEDQFTMIKNSMPEVLPGDFVKTEEPPYHAASDEVRFKELKEALDGDKKYIWAVRGGYGSARLFDGLKKPNQSKIIVGYSDITALHLLANKWGFKSIHGAMPVDIIRPTWESANMHMLVDMINKGKGHLAYNGIKPFNNIAEKVSSVKGVVIGGNLTLIANSIGTNWQLNGKNKIIFIEDIGEKGYALDRNLLHLRQANILKGAKAIVFGQFTGDGYVEYALKRFANDIKIPVFKVEFFGHGDKNYPIAFGFMGNIVHIDEDFTLKIDFDFDKKY